MEEEIQFTKLIQSAIWDNTKPIALQTMRLAYSLEIRNLVKEKRNSAINGPKPG